MSKFLDKTGLDTFWAKIKNTFVKSVKITSSGSELKNSDGNAIIPLASTSAAGAMSSADKLMLDQTALLVSSTRSNSNKAYKLCRFKYGVSYAVGIEGLIRDSYVAYFKLNSYVYQGSSGSWSSSKLSLTYQTVNGVPNAKFYYKVGSATVGDIVDIYVLFPSTYSRYEVGPVAGCKAVPESDNTLNGVYFYNQDVTADWSTLVTELTEIIDNNGSGASASDLPTERNVIAKSTESSGTAPVKVDAYGNLSAVEVDSSPTDGNSTHLVSSDGVKTALDGKEDKSNKVNAWQSTTDNTHYPSEKLVKAEFDKSSDVIITYPTESSRTHKYWKFASATFSGNSRYMFSEWDVILQTNSTYYPFKLIFEAYKSSSSAISIRYAKIVDVKSGTSESALGATEFYVKTQDGTAAPLIIELWCGLTRDSKSSIAIKEFRAGLALAASNPIATRNNSWTYYPNDGNTTTSETKPVTGDGYTVTQFTQMSDKFAYYAERIGKPSTTDGKSVVTSQVGSKSIPVYVKSDGSIDECDVKSEYIPTGTGSDAPVNGQALAAALAGGVDTAKQVVNNDNNVKYKLDSGGLDVYDEQSGQRNSGTKVGISGVEINSGTTESTTLNSSGLDLLKNGQHVKVSHSGFVGQLTGNVTGNVSGSAGSLDVNDVVGGPTVPVYIKADGTPEACTLALNSDVLPITSEKELSSDELKTYTNFLIVNNAKVKIYFERLQPGAAYKFYNPQGSYCDLCFARESNMTCYRTWNSSTEQLQTSVFVSPPSLQRMMGMAVVVRVGTKAYVAGY